MIIKTKQTETGKTEFDTGSLKAPIQSIKDEFFTGKTISDEDLAAIKNYNNEFARLKQEAINTGQDVSNFRMTQEQTNEVMKDASENAKKIANGAQGASVELKGLEKSSKAAEIGMKALAVVGDMFLTWAITYGISLAIDGLDQLANRAKYASEELQKTKQDDIDKYTKDTETVDSLNELIAKYKELREASDYDTNTNTRKQVLDVQDKITNLVGKQASNLDLVNGKLDTQLEKLNKISQKQSKESVKDASNAYYSSKNASNSLMGDEEWHSAGVIEPLGLFSDKGADVVIKRNKKNQEALDILLGGQMLPNGKREHETKFSNDIQQELGTNTFAIYAQGDTAKEKMQYLESMLDALRKEGKTNNDLFTGISSAITQYSEAIEDDYKAANEYVNAKLSDELSGDTVSSLDEFESKRSEIIDELSKDKTIVDAIKNGDLNKDDLETTVDSFMSTCEGFSTWYEKWIGEQDSTTEKKSKTDSLKDRIKEAKKELKEYQDYYNEESKAAKKLGVDLSKTKYGNIDLNDDRKLEWTEDNLKKFGNNIASWYDTNPNIQKKYATVDDFVNHYLGSTSTIDASSEPFNGIEIAFTPMMKTKDGMEYLDADTVYTYIDSLIDEADKDGKRTNEELFKLDAKGLEVDGKKIKGLIADIGDTAIKTSESMHYIGKDGSLQKTADDISRVEAQIKAYRALLKAEEKKTFNETWNTLGTGDGKDVQALATEKDNLLELAKAGQLTEDAFSKSSIAESFTNAGISIKDATKYLNEFVTKSDQLNGMDTGINSIASALSEKKENLKSKKTRDKGVSPDTLAGFSDEVKGLDSWKEFEETLGNGSSTMKDCKKAANELATEWVSSNNFLAQLDKTNKDYYISSLQTIGVENAEEVVTKALSDKHKLLAAQKKFATETGDDLSRQTKEEADKFAEENGYAENLKYGLYSLALQKQLTNGSKLSFDDDINAIIDLVDAAGSGSAALRALSSSKYAFEQGKSKGLPQEVVQAQMAQAQKEVDAARKKLDKKSKNPTKVKLNYEDLLSNTNNNSNGSKNGKDSSTSSSKQTIDWIERALNRVSSTLDLIKAKAENLFGKNSLKTLQKQEASLKSQYNILKKQYSYQEKAEKKYLAKANSVKLSSSLKKAVREGRVSGSLKTLIATYGEKTATKIQNYQDYWDKAQDQKKSKEETKQAMRQNKSDRYQLHIDDADARKSRNEAELENLTTAKAKESVLKNTLTHIKTSYDYQIKQAKLENDDVKVAELKAQKKKELRETEIQILQNYADEYEASVSLLETQSSSTTDLGKKNSLIQQSLTPLKNQYAKLIAIAKKEGDITEQKRLQAEYQDKLNEKLKTQFDNVADAYEFLQSGYQQKTDSLNNRISLSEAQGHYVGQDFYYNVMSSQKTVQTNLKKERDNLISKRADQIKQGLSLDSNEYREMTQKIWELDRSIEQGETDIANTAKQIREAKYAIDEFTQSRIDERNNEAEFYKTIMEYKDAFDDNGIITSEGLGILTADVFEIQNYTAKVQEYKDSLADLQKEYNAGNMGYDEFITKNQELTESMRDAQSQVYSMRDAIKSLIEEGLNAQLSALNELIDKYKETLSAEKDLRDYNKTVEEQTKNISTLQKQISALSGDTSEEGRARVQKLQVSLEDAKQQLEDTEYDKRISDIENILDDLSEDYQDFLDDQMDHIDDLVENIITAITVNSGISGEKIKELSELFGITLSDSLLNFIDKSNNTTDADANSEADTKTKEDRDDAAKALKDYNSQQQTEQKSVDAAKQATADAAKKAQTESNKQTTNKAQKTMIGTAASYVKDGKVGIDDIGKSGTLKKGATYYNYALSGGIKKGDKGHTTKSAHSVTIAAIDNNGNIKLKSKNKNLNGAWIPKSKMKFLQGFSTGGRVGDLQKVVKMNGDDGVTINTLKKGEEVLTPYNADLFDKFVNFLPDLVDYNNNLVDIIKPMNTPPTTKVQTGDLTLNIDNIELPNVTDPKEFSQGLISAMKQDKKLQRFWGDATVGSLNNNMSNIYKY